MYSFFAPGPIELLLLAVPVLLIGGVLVLIMLLANEKTRAAGMVLLAVMLLGFGCLVAAGVAAAFFWAQAGVDQPLPISQQPVRIEEPPPEMIEVAEPVPETAAETVEEIEQ